MLRRRPVQDRLQVEPEITFEEAAVVQNDYLKVSQDGGDKNNNGGDKQQQSRGISTALYGRGNEAADPLPWEFLEWKRRSRRGVVERREHLDTFNDRFTR